MENSNKNQNNNQNGSNNVNVNNTNNNVGAQSQNNTQVTPISPIQTAPNIINQPKPVDQTTPTVSADKNQKDNQKVSQPLPFDKNEKIAPIKSNLDYTGKNKLNLIIGLLALALILIGAVYLGRIIKERQNEKREAESANSLNKINCYENDKYFVVVRSDSSNNEGEDILVKSKMNNEEKLDCNYLKEETDFELSNSNVEGLSNSQHFSYLKDELLIVGQGIGEKSDFIIYDLEKREKVYSDNYYSSLLELKDGVLNYWRITNDIPNKENCSKVEEYNKNGKAQIQGKIEIDLNNMNEKRFVEFRCIEA